MEEISGIASPFLATNSCNRQMFLHFQTMVRDEILSVKHLDVRFDAASGQSRPILRDISFSLKKGETFALVGENGSGKSTLAMAIGRLLPPMAACSGTIIFQGQDLLREGNRSLQAIRRNSLAFIFQEPISCLNPIMKVGPQIQEAIPHSIDRSEAKARVLQLLRTMLFENSGKIYGSYPHELSGGMQQRILIAMAMAKSPALIIADEPTSALDVISQSAVLRALAIHGRQNHSALLLITHNLLMAKELSKNLAVLKEGRLVEVGPTDEVFHNPRHRYTKQLLSAMKWLTIDARGSRR